jgi:hypothetical protein
MVLLSIARRTKAGWGTGKLLFFFSLRGVVLVLLGFLVRAASLVRFIDPAPRDRAAYGPSDADMVGNALIDVFQVCSFADVE